MLFPSVSCVTRVPSKPILYRVGLKYCWEINGYRNGGGSDLTHSFHVFQLRSFITSQILKLFSQVIVMHWIFKYWLKVSQQSSRNKFQLSSVPSIFCDFSKILCELPQNEGALCIHNAISYLKLMKKLDFLYSSLFSM